MPEQNFSNTCIFSTRYITVFLHLGMLDNTLAYFRGPILDSEITNKKHKSAKNVALNIQCEKQDRVLPRLNLAGNLHITQLKFITILHVYVKKHASPQLWIWVSQTHFSK